MKTAVWIAFAFLTIPAAVAAQTEEVEVQALGNVSVLARNGAQSSFQTIAPGTKVKADFSATHSLSLRAIANLSGTGNWASVGSSGTVWKSDIIGSRFVPVLTASFLQSGTVGGSGTADLSSSSTASKAQPGPQSFLVTFRAPSNVNGKVRVSWEGRLQGTGSKATASVDVGNDNKIDFAGDAAKSTREERFFPVSFAKGPIVVKVTFTGKGVTSGRSVQAFWQRLKVNMIKTGTCGVSSFGKACGGATLEGGMFTLGGYSILSLKMKGASPNAFFVRVIGSKRVQIPLPGGCTLYSNPDIVDLLRADSSGEYVDAFKLRADNNWKLVFQYVPFDLVASKLVLKGTNGQEASCSGF